MTGKLSFCKHDDGSVHPLPPYPNATFITVDLLDQLGASWRDTEDTDVLVFAEDCRYLVCEYDAERHAYVLSRLP